MAKRPKTDVELWPEKDESRADFMSRCIPELSKCLGPSKAPGVCASKWNASKELGKKGFVTLDMLDGDLAIEPCGEKCLGCEGRDKAFDPNEPRDEQGKWTDGGGSDGGGSGKETGGAPKKPADAKHPGKGYSKGAWVDNKGVIHTSNVYDAQRALFEDRKVELHQVKQVSTLIKRLGETAAEMAEAGEQAPVFNLCNVSVEGTNLFCAEQKGIPRAQMPVIPAKRTKEFIKHLKSLGYKVEKDTEKAEHLRATQSEIDGAKVAIQMERIRKDGFYKRLVISKDDYILDGHHTWAGELGLDAQDGKLSNDKRVKTARVNIGIMKLIEIADKWTRDQGIAKKPAGQKGFKQMTLRDAAQLLPPALFEKYYARARQFLDANPQHVQHIDDMMIAVRVEQGLVYKTYWEDDGAAADRQGCAQSGADTGAV